MTTVVLLPWPCSRREENITKAALTNQEITLSNATKDWKKAAAVGAATGVISSVAAKGFNAMVSESGVDAARNTANSLVESVALGTANPNLKNYALNEAETMVENALLKSEMTQETIQTLVTDPAVSIASDLAQGGEMTRHLIIWSWRKSGCAARVSDAGYPSSRRSKIDSTVRRVPMMTGLPNITTGRCSMYDRQSISLSLFLIKDSTKAPRSESVATL